MKSLSIAVAAICSVVYLTSAHRAEAAGGRGIRADLPCPYGGAGGPNPDLWGPTSGSSPFNPGLVTPNTATLVAGSTITVDQVELAISSAIQYVYYSSPIPSAGDCAADPFNLNPDGPLEQIISYTMAANGLLTQAGDIEVEFNYNTAFNPALATTAGTASFTMGGVTYTSTGGLLPTGTDNDFLFTSAGALKGELITDSQSGLVSLKAGVPDGWTSSGGGTVVVPEIDPTSAITGLTLLVGGLAILRGSRRTLRVAR